MGDLISAAALRRPVAVSPQRCGQPHACNMQCTTACNTQPAGCNNVQRAHATHDMWHTARSTRHPACNHAACRTLSFRAATAGGAPQYRNSPQRTAPCHPPALPPTRREYCSTVPPARPPSCVLAQRTTRAAPPRTAKHNKRATGDLPVWFVLFAVTQVSRPEDLAARGGRRALRSARETARRRLRCTLPPRPSHLGPVPLRPIPT